MQDQYRVEEWIRGENLDEVHRLRYRVLVEEMGKYRDLADHDRRMLIEDEDEWSWHIVAIADDGTIAAAQRTTWGGTRFSTRQIEQYELQPWIDAGLAPHMVVGERALVAPEHRGGPAIRLITGDHDDTLLVSHGVHIGFGACEPHLLSLYMSMGQMPYATHHINSPEAGYLIPILGFVTDEEPLRGIGTDAVDPDGRPSLPEPVAAALAGESSVLSRDAVAPEVYLRSVRDALEGLAEAEIGAFDGLDDDETERMLARSSIITCDAGDRLLKAGGIGRNIFVVLDGTLEVKVGGSLVGVLTRGDAFGETAFLLDLPRTADVYAATDGPRVLSMSDGAVRKMIAEDPVVAARFLLNVSRMLCTRLIKAN